MPQITINYQLPFFTYGDKYSSTFDRRRFSIIDNELALLGTIPGDGLIEGWDITNGISPLEIKISEGIGIISKVVTRTFGDIYYTLNDNSTSYIYMQKIFGYSPGFGVLGGFSSYSNIANFIYTCIVPPSIPTGLSASSITYNSITLTWNANPEVDVFEYILQKSIDNINFVNITTTPNLTFIDNNVSQDTIYYYKLIAINSSNLQSLPSPSLLVKTNKDLTPPLNPSYLFVLEGDSILQALWNQPPHGVIDHYLISIQAVDSEYISVGPIIDFSVPSNLNSYIIDGLQNLQIYQITIQSVSNNNVYSSGITLYKSPKYNNGPSEIQNLTLSYSPVSSNLNKLKIDLLWTPIFDSYKLPAVKFWITVIQNGDVISIPIPIVFNNKTSIQVFNELNTSNCLSILPYMDYILIVQGEDSKGNLNNGIAGKILTGILQKPTVPINLSGQVVNNQIYFSWKNTATYLNYNLINVTETDANTNVTTTLINNLNHGKNETYVITSPINRKNYTIYITTFDIYGNQSDQVSVAQYYENILPDRPPAGIGTYCQGGDKQVLIRWGAPSNFSQYIQSYQIWRAPFTTFNSINASSYSIIASVDNTKTYYTDYSVENNKYYIYFVTITDVNGNKSLNPIDDGYYSYPIASAYVHKILPFDDPNTITVTNPSGYDLLLTWGSDITSYNGYEYWRSIGDQQHWEKIGQGKYGDTSFLDVDVLAAGTNTYFYMIRKYRNEARIIVQNDNLITPVDAIILGKVTTSGGVITNIESTACVIKNMYCPMQILLGEKIGGHHHSLTSSVDKRIDLNANIIITNWTTSDSREYTTTEVFTGATSYIVKINGQNTNIPYQVDPVNKTIIFSTATPSTNIILECIGLNETQGLLSPNNLGTIDAFLAEFGHINTSQFDTISHMGRMEEKLIPLSIPMTSEDNYIFKPYQSSTDTSLISVGSGTTFYDVLKIADDKYIAATSNGLMQSNNKNIWTNSLQTEYVVHKIIYSSNLSKYFALANGYVYISTDGLSWYRTNTIGNTSIARDLIDNGTIPFVSTDGGIYALDIVNWEEWNERTILSGQSSNSYAMFKDTFNNIFVSTEIGLFKSIDLGLTWSLDETILPDKQIVYQFLESEGYIFALTSNSILRKHQSEFVFYPICNFNANEVKKIVIFNNQLLINTSSGLFVSDYLNDIYLDSEINISLWQDNIKFNNNNINITSLNVLGTNLGIGSDNKFFSGASLDYLEQNYNITGLVPTIYVNNEEANKVFYNTNSNIVVFLEKINCDDFVTIANQYKYYKAQNGGWINGRYDATVEIYKNSILYDIISRTSTPADSLNAVTFETFTEYNSNSTTANIYKSEYTTNLNAFLGAVNAFIGSVNSDSIILNGQTTQEVLNGVYNLYDKTYSQTTVGYSGFSGDIEYYSSIITSNAISYIIIDKNMYKYDIINDLLSGYNLVANILPVPTENVLNTTLSANIVDGVFTFPDNANFNKYDDIRVNILKTSLYDIGTNTHQQLEDQFEKINSGLPADLAEIQQVNILKNMIFLDKLYPYYEDPINETQAGIITPHKYLSFWYDYINSTANFYHKYECVGLGVSIDYPTAVVYIPEIPTVLVGSLEGAIQVNTVGLDMIAVDFNEGENETVKDIKYVDGNIYILTEENLYISEDLMITWSQYSSTGLTGKNVALDFISNNTIVATTTGIFYYDDLNTIWIQTSNITNIKLMSSSDLIFVLSGNILYSSNNGINWNKNGMIDADVNKFTKYRFIHTLCTNTGLRYDNGEFYSNSDVHTSLVNIKNDVTLSSSTKINDIQVNSTNDGYAIGDSQGNYYVMENGTITEYTDSDLPTIHKVLYVEDEIWLFGNDLLKVPRFGYSVKLSSGTPF